MAEPTILGDIVQPAWQGLTPEQRTCWHFWAAANPLYDELGRLRTLYGNQAHYHTNANIAVLQTEPLLQDPPTTTTPPATVAIITIAWPLQSLITGTTTARYGLIYLELDEQVPADTAVIVKQAYTKKTGTTGRPARTRHVTIILPLATADVPLDVPDGYYATTAGVNRYATIKGRTAQRRPDRAAGKIRIVNLLNGQTVGELLKNPYGGSKKKTNRARATANNPTAGVNHYP